LILLQQLLLLLLSLLLLSLLLLILTTHSHILSYTRRNSLLSCLGAPSFPPSLLPSLPLRIRLSLAKKRTFPLLPYFPPSLPPTALVSLSLYLLLLVLVLVLVLLVVGG